MIYHCIRFTLKPGIAEQDKAAGLAQMSEHINAIPSITARIVGPDFGGEFDYGAVTLVADLAAYEEYMNHPAHLAMDRVGLPLVDKFVSFDITDDPDPEVGARIAEIHRHRFENLPDIAELVSDLDDYSGSAAPGKHRHRPGI
ncbi:Dabb family protein [Nocardia brasiliensis]|uniref:Stress responsive alpha-beta barrel domain-containing protein n=1 Tax=Nocardia brasiliensis (strain ATCC 700358 / HUJEG-1) TaxID=1133849 RepID=K0F283_NOCB7|nr:Dabb family protein [Nocardia brasiliensis]AFU03807.1 stress responsive alpha-beta barrel domain-containing protein [Nocardia brasiliensis ATCC 700358]OCF89470.1 stress responsive protein [Nocardia brasiliensis]